MKVLEPMVMHGHTIKNRIVMPPMCTYSATAGMVSDVHLAHYTARALGGVGTVVVEATGVLPEGRISDNCLGLWSDDQIPGMKRLVDAVHQAGSTILVQLNHAGRKCQAQEVPTIFGPSAHAFDETYRTPVALTKDGIAQVVDAFAAAAARAAQAGFDGIEIHAAHGYLIDQFMSPLSNHRDDAYGGSTENRARLLHEVVAAVHAALPEDLLVWVRVSAEDYEPEGLHPTEVAAMLCPI